MGGFSLRGGGMAPGFGGTLQGGKRTCLFQREDGEGAVSTCNVTTGTMDYDAGELTDELNNNVN